jgi:hypothetical protein
MGGPRARTVSQSLLGGQESVLPFGIGLQEFVPFSPYVGEEAGAMVREGQETDSGLTTGLGLGLGALQAFPVAKPLARGAKAAGKALGPKAAEMAEGYLLKSGLAPSVIKPKGGNWLAGTVEKQTKPLRSLTAGGMEPADALADMRRIYTPEETHPDLMRRIEPSVRQLEEMTAVNNWVDTKLNKYIKNEMGTPEDPVRALAERGVTHLQDPPPETVGGWTKLYRKEAGFPEEGLGQSPQARDWENITDRLIASQSAGKLRGALKEYEGAKTTSDIHGGVDRILIRERVEQLKDTFKNTSNKQLEDEFNVDYKITDKNRDKAIEDWARMEVEGYYRGNPEDILGPQANFRLGLTARDEADIGGKDLSWLEKVPSEQRVYGLISDDVSDYTPGFEHLIDELRNATRADSDLPANLRWKPEDLKKVTMAQAVERVAKINEYRAAQMAAAQKAAREGIPLHKEYEGGFQWMAAPDTAIDPKSLQYIKDVGCEGGWCTQGEGLAKQYGGDEGRLYVLHDPAGKPVVQISVKTTKRELPEREIPWEVTTELKESAQQRARAIGEQKGFGPYSDEVSLLQSELYHEDLFQWRSKNPQVSTEILEIKGRQNRAPKEEYLPMVQDFVRSGNWSRVGDFKNTGFDFPATGPNGIFDRGDIYRLNKAGIDVPNYLTQNEAKKLQDKLYQIDTGKNPETGQAYARGGLVTDTDAIAAKLKSTGMDDQKAFMQALRMADARQEAHMAGGGLLKALKGAKAAAEAPKPVAGPQAKALETARKNAVKAGLSPDPNTRMLQLGFGPDWYHGSSGDIKAFRPDYLGESTGAQSAKKAYFFARDPQNPPPEMLEKAPASSESVQLLKRLGIPEEEIAKLNEVSMKGHGAETASGYSAIGGSREYKEAMRKANAAERSGNWDEYHKWMQIAEDTEIGRSQDLQRRVAEYGEKRDVMLDRINNALLSKPLPQEEATALDAKMKQLMPYGWYNIYSLPQFESLKGELVKLAGPNAAPALKSIDDFMSVKANRMLEETYEEGSNVMPVALRYKNPMVHDYGGSSYRDESYSDLIDQAQALGHDALILKNTFDPGRGPAKLVDVAAVFKPEQVRSRFAAFDPARINESDLLGAADPALLAGVAVGSGLGLDAIRRIKKEEQKPEEQKKARGGLAKRV